MAFSRVYSRRLFALVPEEPLFEALNLFVIPDDGTTWILRDIDLSFNVGSDIDEVWVEIGTSPTGTGLVLISGDASIIPPQRIGYRGRQVLIAGQALWLKASIYDGSVIAAVQGSGYNLLPTS